MKQLVKLGSQGARELSDDQMVNITGGQIYPGSCMPFGVNMACSTEISCSITKPDGTVLRGFCNVFCDCLPSRT